jgi:3-(3-hydroxy-phenyl)propionate hydroxylase
MHPGAPLADAPVRHQGQDGWLLQHTGNRFVLLLFVAHVQSLGAATRTPCLAGAARIPVHTLLVTELEARAPEGCTLVVDHGTWSAGAWTRARARAYLLRPDQHVAHAGAGWTCGRCKMPWPAPPATR